MPKHPKYVEMGELVGKTVLRWETYDNCMYLFFTDGSWSRLRSRQRYDEDASVEFEETADRYDLYQVHLITKEEYDELGTAEAKQRNEEAKRSRLRQYEQLRQEFEGK